MISLLSYQPKQIWWSNIICKKYLNKSVLEIRSWDPGLFRGIQSRYFFLVSQSRQTNLERARARDRAGKSLIMAPRSRSRAFFRWSQELGARGKRGQIYNTGIIKQDNIVTLYLLASHPHTTIEYIIFSTT